MSEISQTERVSNEELDQMIWKLERDGMTPKMLSLMREVREVRKTKPVTLSVWYGAMPESNGRENWTAMLHRKGAHPREGIMIDRSEYPGRALYEADRMRFLIGEIDAEPDILAYDSETHSGYVEKLNQPVSETERTHPNSFTNAELGMMSHGDNPQANAYRELLAFRRNSPVSPDSWIPVSDHSMLPPLKYLDTVKFNADCAIQDPESIYANEFFLSLDEVFGGIGNYSEPVQAKAVSILIAEVFRLRGYSPAAPKEVGDVSC